MDQDPRKTALDVLIHWQGSAHTLDLSLEKYSAAINRLSPKDKNLCNALIFGVLRNRNFIDQVILSCSTLPLEKIHTGPLYLLRMALFQIIYLDRVPDFAAINTAVEIAKKRFGKKISGYVNAVLRNGSTRYPSIALPDQAKQPAGHIEITGSLPLWLAKRWVHRYGFEQTRSLCAQINTIPPITLRTNTLKIDRQTLISRLEPHVQSAEPAAAVPDGICITHPDSVIQEMNAFCQGWFQIQDEAAQLVTDLLDPRPGERILDACAGLGGKTGHMAQLMNNTGHITAMDIDARKLAVLDAEMHRLGISIVRTLPMDMLQATIKQVDGYFDRVLIDAPCTGLGVLRRNPDARWKRVPGDIIRLAAKQKKLINAAANLVAPGGYLVFAVCSCEPEENEKVIEHFLNKRKDFTLDTNAAEYFSGPLLTPQGYLKTYPAAENMDGFFAAKLRRKPR